MALLKPVVLTSKKIKGGRNKVRISVAHNGETRYIVTNIILESNNEFRNGMVVKRADAAMLNTKIRTILQRYQSALDEIEYTNGLSCSELVYMLCNLHNDKYKTLSSIYTEYIEVANIKPSTRKAYRNIWNAITKYIDRNMLIGNINHLTILKLDKYLRGKGLSTGTMRSYLTFFSSLLCYAKRCGYIQYKVDPFCGYEMPKADIRNSWLSTDEIKILRDFDIKSKKMTLCRDIIMLSYYLGGINMIDLIKINFNEQKDTLRYERSKTESRHKFNKFVEFEIPDEAKQIIQRVKSEDGFIRVTNNPHESSWRNFISKHCKNLAKLIGIPQLIYYSARKSFSQHAFLLGVNTQVIDYILGHKINYGGSSIYAYISVTPAMATEGVRKVLDNLK